jgi:urea transporter
VPRAIPGLFFFLAAGFKRAGDFDHAFGRIFTAVQHHVFDALAQLGDRDSLYTPTMPALTMPMVMPAWIA